MNWIQFRPGQKTLRAPSQKRGYEHVAAVLWDAYADVFYATMYGFENTRQPRPGVTLDEERYEAWRKKVFANSMNQSLRSTSILMPEKKPTGEDMMPEHLWQYFYERCLPASG